MYESKSKIFGAFILTFFVITVCVLGASANIKSLKAEYDHGKELLEAGQYDEAYEVFSELSENPSFAKSTEFEKMRKLSEDYMNLRKAETLIAENNYYEALKLLLPVDYIPETYDMIQECILHILMNPATGESYS